MTDKRLTIGEIVEHLNSLAASDVSVRFDERSQTFHYVDGNDTDWALALPLVSRIISQGSTDQLLRQIESHAQTYTIILIQAGAAALGYYQEGRLERHKVIKKYMVRKKQGKSQIKHLKSKGKSRLGSRIRLKNTILFFEEINSTLNQWDVATHSEAILLAVPINMKSLLFSSNIPVPFEKKDPRVKKIPFDIRVPSLKELEHINWLASRGTLKQI